MINLESGDNRQHLVETLFPRFLHLLSHHTDLSLLNGETFEDAIKYIEFLVDACGVQTNLSFMFFTAAKLKSMKDNHSSDSHRLYVLCDLAQLLIKEFAARKGWALGSYDEQVTFTRDIFSKLGSIEGKENVNKSFLDDEFVEKRERQKEGGEARKKRSKKETDESSEDEMEEVEVVPAPTRRYLCII